MPDETCRAFDSVAPFDADAVHRFVVGADAAPRRMTAAELRKLGDPFASLLLARGKIPRSGEELVEKIRASVPKGDPLRTLRTFLVGEGSQLASANAGVDATLRFVVTLGRGPDGPDVFLSTGDPKQPGSVEVMGWDRRTGGFNYYRSTGPTAMWMFAGNSRDALRESSRGKGPFESHPSGALLMKELKTPWNNWHSPNANIPANAFAKNDPRRKHAWFTKKDPGGALALELDAARPAISRWARARFRRLRKRGGTVARAAADHGADPRHADRQPDHHPHREPRARARPVSSTSRRRSSSTRRGSRMSSGSPRRRSSPSPARSTRSAWTSSTSGWRTARASCARATRTSASSSPSARSRTRWCCARRSRSGW